MKKILLLLLLSTTLLAEDFTFSGMYLPEVRREISKKSKVLLADAFIMVKQQMVN